MMPNDAGNDDAKHDDVGNAYDSDDRYEGGEDKIRQTVAMANVVYASSLKEAGPAFKAATKTGTKLMP